jgi:hypothetical protein
MNDQAIVQLCAIMVTRPDDLVAKEMLFDAFFQKRDWLPALALAEELARRQPDVPRLRKAVIATLSNMKRYDETIVAGHAVYRAAWRRPDHARCAQGREFLHRQDR